jgi:hypothetical protein
MLTLLPVAHASRRGDHAARFRPTLPGLRLDSGRRGLSGRPVSCDATLAPHLAQPVWLGHHVIAKTFFLAKEIRAMRTKSLRDKKNFRDHGVKRLEIVERPSSMLRE